MKLHLLPDAEDDAIDFTSMISVLFLLLFFFVLISSYLDEATGLRLSLPQADAAQLLSRDDADSVSLTSADEIWYREAGGEEKQISIQELEQKLRQRNERSRPVLLRCDRRCTFEQFMHLKNAVINAGADTIFEEMDVPK
jgi:biopolymer transport protein ExbD